ncbi:MAG: hypothetical protein WBL70_17720 [Candidatus Acidiferrales bacterium]
MHRKILLKTSAALFVLLSVSTSAWSQEGTPVGPWRTGRDVTCPNGKFYPSGTIIPDPNVTDTETYLCGSSSLSSTETPPLDGSNSALGSAAYNLGFAVGRWLVSGGNSSDANAAAAAAAAAEEQRQAELARQRALEEQKRQEMFDRLSRTLKLSGLDTVSFKGFDSPGFQGLQLKGLGDTAANPGTGLQLKGFSSNTQTAGGLTLKMGDDSQPDNPDDCAGKSWGIPGLPGVYLNDCHQPSLWFPNTPGAPSPIEVAQAAENISGPQRELVDQAVLTAAQNDPALMAPSQDPSVVNFQQADLQYQQASQTQASANQEYTVAQSRVEQDQNVMKVVNSKFDQATASPAQQAALAQMAATAKSDEQASELAKQGFDTATSNVVATRTNATQALAGVSLPSGSTSSVDLSHAQQPLVPQNLGTQPVTTAPAIGANARSTISTRSPAIPSPSTTGTAGVMGLSAPGSPIFDCVGDRTSVARLAAGLPAQDEAIRRTEAALEAAKDDRADAREQAVVAALKTLNSSATLIATRSEAALSKLEGLKSQGINADATMRYRFLEQVRKIAEDADRVVDATQLKSRATDSLKAGYAFGNTEFVEKSTKTLLDDIAATKKLLDDSGMKDEALEDVAAKLALFGFGPIGGPVGEALVHTMANAADLVTEGAQAWNSGTEIENAERNLNVLRTQEQLVREKISGLQQELAQSCP